MRPRRALPVVLCLGLAAAGCMYGRTVALPLAQPGSTPGAKAGPSAVRPGDHLRVHTRDGHHTDLVLHHVDADGDIFGNQQEHVVAADVALVEHRSIDKTRTTLLLAGVGFGLLLLVGLMQAAGHGLDGL